MEYGIVYLLTNPVMPGLNLRRFPDDFMFQLSKEEWNVLRSQIVTLEDLKSHESWGQVLDL